MGDEPGNYEESTYWEPSWTTARGAVMTSNVADIARSWRAVGTGALLSRASSRDQTGTGTVGLGINTAKLHWALGLWVTGGWIVATPSFAGYEAATAYLPPKRITIVVSSTRTEKSAVEGKPSVEIMQAIAAPLAPGNKIPSLGGRRSAACSAACDGQHEVAAVEANGVGACRDSSVSWSFVSSNSAGIDVVRLSMVKRSNVPEDLERRRPAATRRGANPHGPQVVRSSHD